MTTNQILIRRTLTFYFAFLKFDRWPHCTADGRHILPLLLQMV